MKFKGQNLIITMNWESPTNISGSIWVGFSRCKSRSDPKNVYFSVINVHSTYKFELFKWNWNRKWIEIIFVPYIMQFKTRPSWNTDWLEYRDITTHHKTQVLRLYLSFWSFLDIWSNWKHNPWNTLSKPTEYFSRKFLTLNLMSDHLWYRKYV